MGYPTPVGRRTLRRVARAAQHRGVGDVQRRTASGERHNMIDGQVGSGVGGTLVARAPVAVLTAPGTEHAGAEPLPDPRAVQGVVPAAVGLAGVLGAAATRATGDDTTDRAHLHPRIVDGRAGPVYSLRVLRLQVRASSEPAARILGTCRVGSVLRPTRAAPVWRSCVVRRPCFERGGGPSRRSAAGATGAGRGVARAASETGADTAVRQRECVVHSLADCLCAFVIG